MERNKIKSLTTIKTKKKSIEEIYFQVSNGLKTNSITMEDVRRKLDEAALIIKEIESFQPSYDYY